MMYIIKIKNAGKVNTTSLYYKDLSIDKVILVRDREKATRLNLMELFHIITDLNIIYGLETEEEPVKIDLQPVLEGI